MKKVEIQAPSPQKQKFKDSIWKEFSTCPVCNIVLERDERYKVGWIKKTEDGRFLSIRGHILCVDEFYRTNESL